MSPGENLISVWEGIRDPQSKFSEPRPIILVVGKDYNHTRQGIQYTKDARADTILLLAADLKTPKLTGVSIPRDTRVTAPDGVTGKINATLQRGGVKLLMQTIESQFGLHVDHFVVLKADAVKAMVDAVGGVDVDPIDAMFYEDSWGGLKIDIKPGPQHIMGDQAVGFVRFRKTGEHRIGPNGEKIRVHMPASKEEGDIRRTERQQQLIRAVAAQALAPQNWSHSENLVDVAFEQVETDLTRVQVLALATIFRNRVSSDLAGATLPGKDDSSRGTYYWEPDRERSRLTLEWLLKGNETAGRQLTRVAISHPSAERDAANAISRQLSEQGYTAFLAGRNRSNDPVPAVIYRKAAYEATARSIAASLQISTVIKDPGDPSAYWLPEIRITLADNASAPAGTGPDASHN